MPRARRVKWCERPGGEDLAVAPDLVGRQVPGRAMGPEVRQPPDVGEAGLDEEVEVLPEVGGEHEIERLRARVIDETRQRLTEGLGIAEEEHLQARKHAEVPREEGATAVGRYHE